MYFCAKFLVIKSKSYNEKVFCYFNQFVACVHIASNKGRPVRLGSLSGYIGKPKSNRAPAKELVSLYQEDAVLHVNVVAGLLVTVTVKDEDDNILSQELVTAQESDMVIPMGGAIVEVSYNDVNLVGMLY